MRVSKTREGPITAVFRIRGQSQDVAVLPCTDWQHAMRKARRVLPRFDQRNPWLFFDSREQNLYVLLDSDTEPQTTCPPRACTTKARTMTKKGTRS